MKKQPLFNLKSPVAKFLTSPFTFYDFDSLFSGQFTFGTDESREGMGIFNAFLPESPIHNVLYQQFLLKRMAHAEPHPADDTNGHGILIHTLLCTHITLHGRSSLLNMNKSILYF
jgi:hypothetical protein